MKNYGKYPRKKIAKFYAASSLTQSKAHIKSLRTIIDIF
jgi:hypothetical protein